MAVNSGLKPGAYSDHHRCVFHTGTDIFLRHDPVYQNIRPVFLPDIRMLIHDNSDLAVLNDSFCFFKALNKDSFRLFNPRLSFIDRPGEGYLPSDRERNPDLGHEDFIPCKPTLIRNSCSQITGSLYQYLHSPVHLCYQYNVFLRINLPLPFSPRNLLSLTISLPLNNTCRISPKIRIPSYAV